MAKMTDKEIDESRYRLLTYEEMIRELHHHDAEIKALRAAKFWAVARLARIEGALADEGLALAVVNANCKHPNAMEVCHECQMWDDAIEAYRAALRAALEGTP